MWCRGEESNFRHEALQATALPLSYLGIVVLTVVVNYFNKTCLMSRLIRVWSSKNVRLITVGLVIWIATQKLFGNKLSNLYWSKIAKILLRILFRILARLEIFLEIITKILKISGFGWLGKFFLVVIVNKIGYSWDCSCLRLGITLGFSSQRRYKLSKVRVVTFYGINILFRLNMLSSW